MTMKRPVSVLILHASLYGASSWVGPCRSSRRRPLVTSSALSAGNRGEGEPSQQTLEKDDSSALSAEDENCVQAFFRSLAALSLMDYQWRSDLFKTKQADRMVEQSLARMTGDFPHYVRPMDAESLGPLGELEKSAVEWVSSVIDEEGRRAEQIVNAEGRLVRPKDVSPPSAQGPLGLFENSVSDFFQSINMAEKERARTKTIRPKDVPESMRGPLGEAEMEAVRILKEIQASEKARMEKAQSQGRVVRPIDVPGPLGEFEMKVLEIFDEEQRRSKIPFLRPKDALVRGPLGETEQQAFETIQQLRKEERERFESIKKILAENRPMNNDKYSLMGLSETVLVGVLRAPVMLFSVYDRVRELMKSQKLEKDDQTILQDASRPNSVRVEQDSLPEPTTSHGPSDIDDPDNVFQ